MKCQRVSILSCTILALVAFVAHAQTDVLATLRPFDPSSVHLRAGGPAAVVKVNSNGQLRDISLEVIKDGRTVPGVTGSVDLTSGHISLRADAKANPAVGCQLKLSATQSNKQKIEAVVPSSVFSIEVLPMSTELVLAGITPSSGERGSTAVVTGNGFLGAPTIHVYFVGAGATEEAEILERTDNLLKVRVPPSGQSGTIAVMLGDFPNPTTKISDFSFTVIHRPTIESFSPTAGLPGTRVEVRGFNYDRLGGSLVFKFSNEAIASYDQVGSVYPHRETQQGALMKAYVTVPASAVTGPLKVSNHDGTATSAASFTVVK